MGASTARPRNRVSATTARIGATCFAVPVLSAAATGVATAGKAGAQSGELLEVSGWVAVAAFLIGGVILLASVEVLVHALVRTAARFGVSTLLLAIVFSGIEFDNVAFGVFTGFREMQNVAFGLAIGNAISIFGLSLGLAALAYPFEVEIPRDYLAVMVLAPLILLPVLSVGRITRTVGLVLILVFVVVFGYVTYREFRGERSYMRSEEVMEAGTSADGEHAPRDDLPRPIQRAARCDWFWPLVMVLALGGVIVGAESSAAGTEGIVRTWNLTGTFAGVTLVTIVFTLDDLLLTLEPIRLGYHEIGVGGVIGSLLFFVTANTGLVALVGTITVTPRTVSVHLPFLIGITAVSGYLVHRGRLTRRSGAVLLGLYAIYLGVNVYWFATLPVSG